MAALKGAEVCAVSRTQPKLNRALVWGAIAAICASRPDWIEAVREWTGGFGTDVVVEAMGSPDGLYLASGVVRPRGTIALKTTCGLPAAGIDVTKLVVSEVQVHTSRCGPFSKAIELLARRRVPVESLVSEIHPLNSVTQAIESAKTATKVLIQPNMKLEQI